MPQQRIVLRRYRIKGPDNISELIPAFESQKDQEEVLAPPIALEPTKYPRRTISDLSTGIKISLMDSERGRLYRESKAWN